jgi:hypothetical protein
LEKRRAGGRIRGVEDLGIREPGRIIDGDVQILPADATRPTAPVAVDAMSDADDAAQTFEIDVEPSD